MKKILTLAFLLLLSLVAYCQVPAFRWAKPGDVNITTAAMTTSASGDLYATGTFIGTVDFNPGTGMDTMTDHGFGDIFISKRDSSGNLLWVKTIGGTSYDEGSDITTDASGNIYVAGFFSTDSVDFDPGPAIHYMSATENSYVLKLDPNGNFIWVRQVVGIAENYATSIKLDLQGNILISGNFQATADFDPGSGVDTLTSPLNDMYIWKLDNNGNYIWARQFSGTSVNTRCFSIGCDNAGNVYMSGILLGTEDFDPSPTFSTFLTNTGTAASFIVSLNSAGAFRWARKFDNTDIILSNGSLQTDAAGNCYLAGSFSGIVDFDPNAGIQSLTASAGNNHFLLQLSSNADFSWVKQIDDVKCIALDELGNIYALGSSLRKWSAAGNSQWTSNNHLGRSITVDRLGGVYEMGSFSGTVDVDPGPGIFNMVSAGTNTFVERLSSGTIASVADPLLGGDTFRVFPNPANNELHIYSKTAGELTIVDALGRVVRTASIQRLNMVMINMADLQDGIYFLSGLNSGVHTNLIIRH